MDQLNCTTLDFDCRNFTDVVKFDQYGNRLPLFSVDECNFIKDNNLTNLFENITCLSHAPVLTHSRAVRAAVLLVLAVLSFFANIATIVSIYRNRKHRLSSVYSLILHLTIADLFVTIFCIAGEASWTYMVEWVVGNLACKIFKFTQLFGLYLSTFVLVLIGVDRFVAVRYPMKALASKYCNRFVVGAWVLSAICSIPQLAIFHVEVGPFVEVFHQCVSHGFYTSQWQEQLYCAISLLLMFVLPLVILVSTYVSTVCTIAKSERLFKAEIHENGATTTGSGRRIFTAAPDLNRRRLMQRAKVKSLRISVVIVVAFIIWWMPYNMMLIYFMFVRPTFQNGLVDAAQEEQDEALREAIFFFGMSNSLVNPLIYGAFHLWKPRPRANSYRSAHLNRDGSTRRSTATHVSVRRRDSHGAHVVVTPAPRNPVPLPDTPSAESTALVSLESGGSVKARLVTTTEDPGKKPSSIKHVSLPDIILRYGVKNGRAMQTRI